MKNHAHPTESKQRAGRRGLSLLLALCLALTLIPALPRAARAADEPQPDDRVQSSLDKLVDWGVMRGGDANGNLYPNRSLTRAEFTALVNRAYGYTRTGSTPFTDVSPNEWYADDISIAYNTGYFMGTSATTAGPKTTLSREQALVLLARSLRLEQIPGQVVELSDGDKVSDWARGYVRAAAQMGIIDDDDGNGFRPTDIMTRGEMADLLAGCVGSLVQNGGEHSLGNVYGNVTINQSGTTLKDTVIAGDLYLTGGVDLGGVTLENVTVLGKIVVAGGGESEGGKESVILRNVEADSLLLDSITGQYNSICAEGDTSIQDALLRTSAYIQDRSDAGYGLLNLTLDSKSPEAAFTLSGNLKNVINKTPDSSLIVADAVAERLTIDEKAAGSTLRLDTDAVVRQLNLDTAIDVTGVGDIDKLQVNTAGSSVEMLPDKIDIRPGLVASVAGEDMDPAGARESSSEPRLLAGYPKVTKLASTSATAVFSANKPGTIYWAVSTVADGSISENDLLDPGEYTNRAIQQGSVKAEKTGAEVTADIKELTRSGTYYLSAILVDGQGRRSPLKVASFTTPDDTVPAFAQGYPKMTRITIRPNGLQAMVMTTKSCNLYYVLLPSGSTTPTPNDFKVGAFNKDNCLGYSAAPVAITRNMEREIFSINNASEKLAELSSYDLYFWLNDVDGAKSSAVTKLTFQTQDETPPEFKYSTRDDLDGSLYITQKTGESLVGKVVVNEDATVYWAVVSAGTPFPLDSRGQLIHDLNSREAQTAIKSGFGSLFNGSVNARKDTETTINNIRGLKGGRSYDIYYVAEDTAKPIPLFSEVKHLDNQRTSDTEPPTVSQDFSKKNDLGQPYPDGSVYIIFSEDVRKTTEHGSEPGESLLTLYDRGDTEKLAELLRSTVKLYDMSDGGEDVIDRKDSETKWVIDYTKVTVSRDTNPDSDAVIVTFKGNVALRLGSGNKYQFRVSGISDTADKANLLNNGNEVKLDEFTVVRASIKLTKLDFFGTKSISVPDKDDPETLVPIDSDAGFSFNPISTTSAPASDYWDMVFRTNLRVEFELYRRDSENDPWVLLGSLENRPDKGLSLHKDFLKEGFPLLRSLQEDEIPQYGIRVVRIGQYDSRGSWGQRVEFTINVVSGESGELKDFTGRIASSYDEKVGNGKVLAQISDPGSLILAMPFSNSDPPYLVGDYPTFKADASSVKINVFTNVSAKLHWMLAEVSPTTAGRMESAVYTAASSQDASYNFGGSANDVLDFSKVPDKGIKADNTNKKPKFILAQPSAAAFEVDEWNANEAVTRPDHNEPVVTNANIRTEFTLNGLKPEQDYYFYFYLAKDGEESDVYVYKFQTTKIDYPIAYAEWKLGANMAVSIRNKVQSAVDYMLYDMSSSQNDPLTIWLTSTFETVDVPGSADKTCTGGYPGPHTYTVLQALSNRYMEGTNCSYFDQFASDAAKAYLWNELRGTTTATKLLAKTEKRIFTANPADSTKNYAATIHCANNNQKDWQDFARDEDEIMVSGLTYAFFAFAYLETDADKGIPHYSVFAGRDLRLDDTNYPTAKASGGFTEPLPNSEGYTGFSITLAFDRLIYAQVWDEVNQKGGAIKKIALNPTADTKKIEPTNLGIGSVTGFAVTNKFASSEDVTLRNLELKLDTPLRFDGISSRREYSYTFNYALCDIDGRAAVTLPGTLTINLAIIPVKDAEGKTTDLTWEVTATYGGKTVTNLPLRPES